MDAGAPSVQGVAEPSASAPETAAGSADFAPTIDVIDAEKSAIQTSSFSEPGGNLTVEPRNVSLASGPGGRLAVKPRPCSLRKGAVVPCDKNQLVPLSPKVRSKPETINVDSRGQPGNRRRVQDASSLPGPRPVPLGFDGHGGVVDVCAVEIGPRFSGMAEKLIAAGLPTLVLDSFKSIRNPDAPTIRANFSEPEAWDTSEC